MDEVTLVGAGLIGAGIAVLGLALVAGIQRANRVRVRSRQPPRRPAPGPRPAAPRPAPTASRPAAPAPARVRPANDDSPQRPRRPQAAARNNAPRRPGVVPARALEGETLQLGPVPAWRLPIRPRNEAPNHRFADDPAAPPTPDPPTPAPPPPVSPPASDPAPPRASRELVSRAGTFGWFMPGR